MRHCFIVIIALLAAGCARQRPGAELIRRGDEIVVCGRMFHTGAPVVLWTDPGGYDAYRVERRFASRARSDWASTATALGSPNRYGLRTAGLTEQEIERVRGGAWDLPTLQRTVDQFVIHYDVCGTSRQCFRVLHDMRGLSVHFLLDIDGTIYQTLDVKERAWHAGEANDRSVGIEIANIGAYGAADAHVLDRWYTTDPDGRTRITIPPEQGDGGVRTPGFVGRPARPGPVVGAVQGRELSQYDLTREQYDSLIKLTAALCTILPRIECDYPRDEQGDLITGRLPDDRLAAHRGLLGHYHVSDNKIDPGPAFQWDHVVNEARDLMRR